MNFYKEQAKNKWRTVLLMTIFTVFVVGFGYALSHVFHNPSLAFGAVLVSLVMNGVGFWFSDSIALASSGAQQADEQEWRSIHDMVENLSKTAGIQKPRVYIIEEDVPNAFATGRNQRNAAVALTTGLIQRLDKAELEGVIAHELAHIGNQDILIGTIAVVLAGCISMLSDFVMRMTIFGGVSSSDDEESSSPWVMVVSIVFAILAPIFALLLQMALSRKREFLADATAVEITRYPEGLARALEKISSYQGEMSHLSQGTAHLYIANPFLQAGKTIANLFSTHPPIQDRIDALRASRV